MSALNCFVTPDAVHLFTDGGHYDLQSVEVCGIGTKNAILPEYDAVIAAVGYAAIPWLVASSMAETQYVDLAAVIDDLPEIVRGAIARLADKGGPKDWGAFELVLAGWQDGPIAMHLAGVSKDDRAAFTASEITRLRCPDHPDFQGFKFDQSDPQASGLSLMRRQRSYRFGVPTATPKPQDLLRNIMCARVEDRTDAYQVVHGFCQHTSISAVGIQTSVIERWSDDCIKGNKERSGTHDPQRSTG